MLACLWGGYHVLNILSEDNVLFVLLLLVNVIAVLNVFAKLCLLGRNSLDLVVKVALHLAALPWLDVAVEEYVDLFQRLALGLWVHEENVDRHDETEDAEDDVCSPLDVGERWCDKVC